jgi:hypothetical protein
MVALFSVGIGGCGTKEEVTLGTVRSAGTSKAAMKGDAGQGGAGGASRVETASLLLLIARRVGGGGSRDVPVAGACWASDATHSRVVVAGRGARRRRPGRDAGRGRRGRLAAGGGGPELRGAAAGEDLCGADAAGGL